nr:type IV pilus modification protein PilV [Thiohalomonas denitrificans]
MRERRRATGFSMIEVLVTVIIISVGLLGLAALQSKAQQAELESYQRTQALILLQDMVNRIHANGGTAGCYDITDAATGAPFVGTNGDTFICDSYGTSATRAVADGDLESWGSALKGMEGSTGGTLIGARGCVSYDSTTDIYTVAVAWQGLSSTVAPSNTCGTGLYGDEEKRRVVTATLRIADLK